MAVIQRHSVFPLEKSYLLKLTNVSGTSLLILLHCNAIYVTLDRIQIRTLVHAHKPNHYV